MPIPLTVRFAGVPRHERAASVCAAEASRLAQRDGPRSCEVVIAGVAAGRVEIRIHAAVSGGDVAVVHATHWTGTGDALERGVRDAFDELSRGLREARAGRATRGSCGATSGFHPTVDGGRMLLHPDPTAEPRPASPDGSVVRPEDG
jgi:hypothetical protein